MIKEILILYFGIGILIDLFVIYKKPMLKNNKIMVAIIIGWPFVTFGYIAGKLYAKKKIGDISKELNEVMVDPENMPTDEMNEMMKELQERQKDE